MARQPSPFKEGDFVRLQFGHTKMVVVTADQYSVYARYCGKCPDKEYEASRSGTYDQHRKHNGFRPWDPKNDPTCTHDHSLIDIKLARTESSDLEGTPAMTTQALYQTNEKKVRYGTFMIKNSTGQFVLEMKGEGGKVEAFDEDKLTKVVPYTFSAKSAVHQNKAIHYTGTKGAVKVGDVLVSTSGNVYYVTAINTGCEHPNKAFKGSKLASKPIKE